MLKKLKLKNTNEKAITLIVLIITIIVLLILAGVTIATLTGDNGLIAKATQASEETKKANAKEQVQLATTGSIGKDGNIDIERLNENLEKIDKIGNIPVTGLPALVTVDEEKVIIKENGTSKEAGKWNEIKNSEGEIVITDGITELKIGEYVDYDEQTGATVESYTSEKEETGSSYDQVFNLSSYQYGWRVLGLDEDTNEILLLAEDFIGPDTGGITHPTYDRTYYRFFNNQNVYTNEGEELNKISELYGQGKGSTKARSITIKDINKITGYNPEKANYRQGRYDEYGNEVTFYWDGTDKPYYECSNGVTGSLSRKHDSFSWYDETSKEWKISEKSTTATTENREKVTTLKINYYAYEGNSTGLDTNGTIYKMLFTNSENSASKDLYKGKTDGHMYWLTSSCNEMSFQFVIYNLRSVSNGTVGYGVTPIYYSNQETNLGYSGVRPVISLEADINISGGSGTDEDPYQIK